MTVGMPWVRAKTAASIDGRTALPDGTSQWITGAASRQRVHEQRAAHDAIAVGTGTVLADNPSLTARGDGGELLAAQLVLAVPTPVLAGERLRITPRAPEVLDAAAGHIGMVAGEAAERVLWRPLLGWIQRAMAAR